MQTLSVNQQVYFRSENSEEVNYATVIGLSNKYVTAVNKNSIILLDWEQKGYSWGVSQQ